MISDPENPRKHIFWKKKIFFENFWRPVARPRGAQIEKFLHRGTPCDEWMPFMWVLTKKNLDPKKWKSTRAHNKAHNKRQKCRSFSLFIYQVPSFWNFATFFVFGGNEDTRCQRGTCDYASRLRRGWVMRISFIIMDRRVHNFLTICFNLHSNKI